VAYEFAAQPPRTRNPLKMWNSALTCNCRRAFNEEHSFIVAGRDLSAVAPGFDCALRIRTGRTTWRNKMIFQKRPQSTAASPPPTSYDDIVKKFIKIVLTSPVAIVTLVLSTFLGYGISFVLFDYRRSKVRRSHFGFHVVIGLAYAALIFSCVNYDLLSHKLTVSQITERMPLTLLVSFSIGFLILLLGGIWRNLNGHRR
jgi:hypothetical protein